ncbi:putative sporulation protein YtxC [Paenibacillus sp. GD4]|uniref:putative sporulation protein YtxC n=1 Tax=Paenibacillus sp. GD4 TaxID=3068890 RepID=UPI0027969AAF|nr:putative sporulation protein YtxC [Paenibacillus sp. GD4]MDQ1910161.1 putative sporulation protein YtxC [Paenibacillus sp. GD4]
MKLFTVTLMKSPEELAEKLVMAIQRSDYYVHNKAKLDLSVRRGDGFFSIDLYGLLPHFTLNAEVHSLYHDTAELLADYILDEAEADLLHMLIRREFDYDQEEDIRSIMDYCLQMLDGSEETDEPMSGQKARQRRRHKIVLELEDYLQQNTELHLEGFLRFRLGSYLDELRDVVEYAVDEYVMDRQYQEFISLLKYFVYIQEAKIPFVHLIHKGGNEFMLLNDRMEQIDTDDAEATVTMEMLEKDMNFEDMIVSTLITVSPGQVYIHTREPDVQVIKTIKQIFENRVEICSYCRLCHQLDRTTAAEYNKG